MMQQGTQAPSPEQYEVATLGGGCFWCLEAVYEQVRGVERVESGYAGGTVPHPTYEQVSSGRTGHAEVVQLHFDPQTISYRQLLEILFTIHDPTTPNRQGGDFGPQYRSIILYHSPEQREVAEAVIAELEQAGRWPDSIVTQVEPFQAFYAAEAYHQEYYRRNHGQPYCRAVIDPKLARFRSRHAAQLRL